MNPSTSPPWTTTRVTIALGLGAVVLWIVFFGDTGPVSPAGPAARALEGSIVRLIGASGGVVQPSNCRMMGNLNLSVTCEVSGTTAAALKRTLDSDGWTPVSDPPLPSADHFGSFLNSGVVVTIAVGGNGEVKTVSARAAKTGN